MNAAGSNGFTSVCSTELLGRVEAVDLEFLPRPEIDAMHPVVETTDEDAGHRPCTAPLLLASGSFGVLPRKGLRQL
jgi:hypothetical protein